MLGLGRYLQHKKLSTNPPDDDEYDIDNQQNNKTDLSFDENINNDTNTSEHRSFGILPQSDDIFQVTYLGEEPISLDSNNSHEQIDMQQIYKHVNGPRFSPQNAMSRSKRMELTVTESGINLTVSSYSASSYRIGGVGGKQATNTEDTNYKTLSVPELLLLSTKPLHKKVLVAVCSSNSDAQNGRSGNLDRKKYTLSVLVCQKECHPAEIIDLCSQRLSIKPKNMNNIIDNGGRRMLVEKKRKYSPQHILELVYTVNNESAVDGSELETDIQISEQLLTITSSSLSDDFDLDDEFLKLAMKRTDSLPHHLQNEKSVDSILLIQEPVTGLSNISNTGTGFSFSATRRESLSPSSSSNDMGNGNNFFTKNKQQQQQQQSSSSNKCNFFSPSFYNSYSRVSNGL